MEKYQSRLSIPEIKRIRHSIAKGVNHNLLAEQLGVDVGTVEWEADHRYDMPINKYARANA